MIGTGTIENYQVLIYQSINLVSLYFFVRNVRKGRMEACSKKPVNRGCSHSLIAVYTHTNTENNHEPTRLISSFSKVVSRRRFDKQACFLKD